MLTSGPLRSLSILFLGLGLACTDSAGAAPAEDAPHVKIMEIDKVIRVEVDGALFTEYHYADADRPYFYPVNGPLGDNLTRNWPMKEMPGEEKDHKHHRGLWYTHGLVNNHDFWTEGRGPKIIQDKVVEIKSGPGSGYFVIQNSWIAKDGTKVCTDTRKHTIRAGKDFRSIDFEVTIHATENDVTFGDTKEGTMAIRLPATMRVRGKVANGHIVNSEGDRDKKTWGKSAAWCYYYGPVNENRAGVAIFDHTTNPRYPTYWHVRDYGLFAANPFGLKHFNKKLGKNGDMKIAKGESASFRYRIFLHQGKPDVDLIKREAAAFAATK